MNGRHGDVIGVLATLGERLPGTYRPATVLALLRTALEELFRPDAILLSLTLPDRLVDAYHWEAADDHPVLDYLHDHGPTLGPTPEADPDATLPPSWMGAPLTAAHQRIGAVVLGRRGKPRFAPADLDALRAVVAPASVALVNTRLFQLISLAKREWEQTVDAIPQAFCIVSPRGRIRRANRAFAALTGVPLPALVNRPWHEILPEGAAAAVATALATDRGIGAHEMKLDTRLLAVTAHRMELDGEETAVLVFDDETDKRALQDQVVQSAKLSAIGQLIAGVAHDLNNPLASVSGFAEYLAESREDTPTWMVEPLRAIHQDAERASHIVKNLLAFARKHEGDRHALSIGPVLQSTLLLLRTQLMGYGVDTRVTIPPDLPSIDGNTNQLQQVFVNLLTNAAQAIHASDRPGTITIRVEPWLDGVAVELADDGPGIPGELADRIFEPFFTTKPEGEGTGLGLSICHGIITEHGGRLALIDAGPPGATFRIELPGGTSPAPPPATLPPTPANRHILIVDDEPHILHYVRAALEDWGHTVEVAADGAAALKATGTRAYDVILTDLRMPQVSGRAFYETLLEQDPDLAARVVFCTGDTVAGDTKAFLSQSGRPWLLKPFTLNELRTTVASVAPAGRPPASTPTD